MKTQFSNSYDNALKLGFTLLRVFIGWHLLYEGLTKVFSPWSSVGYLMESQWLLSGIFHRVAENPVLLQAVDVLNIFGLIAVGLGLFLGIFTRISALGGAFLILLYYIANPPFMGYFSENTGEGHYLIVNKQLIEMAALVLIAFLPKKLFWGFDRGMARIRESRAAGIEVPGAGKRATDEAPASGDRGMFNVDDKPQAGRGRREMLKDLMAVPFLGGFAWVAFRKKQWESFEEHTLIGRPSRIDAVSGATARVQFASLDQLKQKVPTGTIKDYEISRLICGGNLISGFAHSRDLIYVSQLLQSYFSDEKVLETFKLCEAVGINTMILRVDEDTLRLVEKYRRRGGTLQWIAQCQATDEDIRSDIDAAVSSGAIGVFLHGGVSDDYVRNNRIDYVLTILEYMKRNDRLICGLAAHDLQVVMASEKNGLGPDFYMKTLNSGNYWTAGPRLITDPEWKPDPGRIVEPEYGVDAMDNIWSRTPEQTVEFMKGVDKPWIAYKVLGAGAIHPKEGFSYAFSKGADFACVGMFDFQVVENANILADVMAELPARARPWKS